VIGAPAQLVAQDLVTFRFHGVVDQIQIDEGPAPPGVSVGSSFDGIYSFDPAASDSANYDYHGVYHTKGASVVQASIENLHWHADESFVAIIDGQPQQTDIYEAGASRITLDSPPELAELLDIWIFHLTLQGDGGNLSDASLLQTPPDLSDWSKARLLMIGESSTYSNLDPVPAVMITASLTELELAGDFDGDGDIDSADLAPWQENYGGGSPTHREGDANGDGVVDGADFLAWQGQVSVAAASGVTIPEPHYCVLTAALCTVVVLSRR
jgi:hypothetical protein